MSPGDKEAVYSRFKAWKKSEMYGGVREKLWCLTSGLCNILGLNNTTPTMQDNHTHIMDPSTATARDKHLLKVSAFQILHVYPSV